LEHCPQSDDLRLCLAVGALFVVLDDFGGRLKRDEMRLTRHRALALCLRMISAQTLRVCREGKPLFSGSCFSAHYAIEIVTGAHLALSALALEAGSSMICGIRKDLKAIGRIVAVAPPTSNAVRPERVLAELPVRQRGVFVRWQSSLW